MKPGESRNSSAASRDRARAARLWVAACLLLSACLSPTFADDDVRSSTVGVSQRIDQVVLQGSELKVVPQDAKGSVVLRIIESFPHGTDFRYDLEYRVAEPGTYNLVELLRRKDGTSTDGLTEINVEITPTLGPGQVEPHTLQYSEIGDLGGYQQMMTIGAVVWVVGLLLLLFVGRKKCQLDALGAEHTVTLADRLSPMISDAIAGKLPRPQLAELELMLVAFWRKRLELEDTDAAEVIPELRQHSEAGPLLTQLEEWLHKPGLAESVDLKKLLEPYRNLPEDALDSVSKTLASKPQTAGS